MDEMTLRQALDAADAEIISESPIICTIDADTRVINTPPNFMLGVESDEKAKRVFFRCPKIVGDNIDLTFLHLYINYQNAANEKNVYFVDDLREDGEEITFSWLLSRHVTQVNGIVHFIVCAKKNNGEFTEIEWNTKTASGSVGEGLEAQQENEELHSDLLEQLLTKMDNATADIAAEAERQIEAVQAEGTEQIAKIQTEADSYVPYEKANALAIHQSASGRSIHTEDSADWRMMGMNVYGRTEQVKTTGAQLLDTDSYEVGNYNSNNGLPENNSSIYRFANSIPVNAGETLYSLKNLFRLWYKADGTFIKSNDAGGTYIIVPNDAASLKVRIFSNEFETFNPNNYMISRSPITAWEPYTGGKPSPSPEYPQELVSVGDGGNVGVDVLGGNLAYLPNLNAKVYAGVTWSCNNGVVTAKGTAVGYSETTTFLIFDVTTLPNGTYFVSGNKSGCNVYVSILKDGVTTYYTNTSFVKDGTEEKIKFYLRIKDGVTLDTTVYPMLNRGSFPVPWERYKKQTLTLPTPNGLPGIPVESGGNYTDEDGQQYVADEVCLQDGQWGVERKFVEIIYNGTEIWGLDSVDTTPEFIRFSIRVKDKYAIALCDRLFVRTTEPHGNYEYIYYRNSLVYIQLKRNRLVTQDLEGCYSWLSNNNVKVLYLKNTPVFEPFPEETQNAIKSLRTNYSTTNVMNDAEAHMELSYIVDTRKYMDKEHAKIRAEYDEQIAYILSLLPESVQAAMINTETDNLLNEMEV